MKNSLLFLALLLVSMLPAQTMSPPSALDTYFAPVKYRNIGPFRGGRSVAACGVPGDPLTYYMGTTGGGLWKTTDAGQYWHNISDGYFRTGTVGAVAVAPSDPNVIYVGMGEHAVRGVMTTHGDGVYKSTDGGKTWQHLGLELTRHIAGISVHPDNPDIVYVAAQGALYGPTAERGVYKSADGGATWEKVLFVDDHTGCAHLVMDPTNPRILYAVMWEHQRLPWQVISGGPGSGLYKSTDSGATWTELSDGLPDELGKMSVDVCASNPEKIYLLVESDTEKEQGGLFVSTNGGDSFRRISKDHRLVQRAWYYIEVFADPQDDNTVYVLSAPCLRSTDGGESWERLSGTHGDYHGLWINPDNNRNMVIANDGGAAITFDYGEHWSTQDNMPTAQFYRVNVDNHFPYRIYGGQQDNSSVRIDSRDPFGRSLNAHHWTATAGGESAFLAFDPDDPSVVLGGSYQGSIEAFYPEVGDGASIMAAPWQHLAMFPKDMRYRFNWNAPIIWSRHEPNTFYHGAQMLLKTQDAGRSWSEVSPDLTRNEVAKQGPGGVPYTNEGAGGENYGTLSYIVESPHEAGVIWTGSDDGLVYLTRDGGANWTNVTPAGLEECLINAIEVSPHDPATAYIATTRYKFNDLRPSLYKTTNYGRSWTLINQGLPAEACTRVVREDPVRHDLLLAGTELGLFASFDGGQHWQSLQLNLPMVPVTDLVIRHGDLVVATQGRAFWILDDLGLLRQYQTAAEGSVLYQPEDAYRVGGGSPLDRTDADFTGQDELEGVNPATGMVVYYQLPELPEGTELTLDIRNERNQLIRSFSAKKTESPDYLGAPSPDPVLPAEAGLNRFVWDLRYPQLTPAEYAYLEGSYRGHKAPPGSYNLQLTIGEETLTTRAAILPLPTIDASAADYQAQDEFLRAVAASVNEMHTAVNDLNDVKREIQHLLSRLEATEAHQPLIERGQAILDEITAWDGELIQRQSQCYDDVINFPNKLTAEYLFLKGEMDDNIPFITQAAQARLTELDTQWPALATEYRRLRNEVVPAYETALREAGIGLFEP